MDWFVNINPDAIVPILQMMLLVGVFGLMWVLAGGAKECETKKGKAKFYLLIYFPISLFGVISAFLIPGLFFYEIYPLFQR